MAHIVFGLCTSHSPQLSSPVESWPQHGENDRRNPWLFDKQGTHLTYDQALEMAKPEVRQALEPGEQRKRYEVIQGAVARLQQELEAAAPDVVVIFGDDQAEIFPTDFRPALMVYSGDAVRNMPDLFSRAPYEAGRSAGWAYGAERATIQVPAALSHHIVDCLIEDGFDVAHSTALDNDMGLGHAYGFIFGRIMNGHSRPLIPIILNTLYPPNQPTARRCYELGRAVRRAIDSWPEDVRAAVVGSGGLSHFLIDEELDQRFLQALRAKDGGAMCSLPQTRLQSGTGEIRSWIAAAAALQGLPLVYTEYQPCYRSPAGTGMGMGFAVWK